jgi:2-polyprenyl-3-methyl-5-hydroxy-6-metoxy-1,4-benzoquinol methylase
VSAAEEKAEYDLHRNDPSDPAYRRFLGRLFRPVQEVLQPESEGLDFGCGPGPTLSVMFEEQGHTMTVYDPFYADDPSALARSYDFITASEVVEHLHHPRDVLEDLWSRLRPGGTLGLMTQLVLTREAFASWRYINDKTHVCFFSRPTFEWLAAQWHTEVVFADRDVVLFHKTS